jgi:hypothetical protein
MMGIQLTQIVVEITVQNVEIESYKQGKAVMMVIQLLHAINIVVEYVAMVCSKKERFVMMGI